MRQYADIKYANQRATMRQVPLYRTGEPYLQIPLKDYFALMRHLTPSEMNVVTTLLAQPINKWRPVYTKGIGELTNMSVSNIRKNILRLIEKGVLVQANKRSNKFYKVIVPDEWLKDNDVLEEEYCNIILDKEEE